MPVVTLTMSWQPFGASPSSEKGCRFEICGENDSIDMSTHKFKPRRTAPYESGSSGSGPFGLLLTPDQVPKLGAYEGATWHDPPMGFATLFLGTLENQGYHVVASHSNSGGPGESYSAVFIWTLKHVSHAASS